MSRVIHFEIPSDNPEQTMSFYKNVFAWEFSQWGDQPYWLIKTGDDSLPGINGAIAQKKEENQPIMNTIEVENLEMTIESIGTSGGQVIVPKTVIPTIGYIAYFRDPAGYTSGILQPDSKAK